MNIYSIKLIFCIILILTINAKESSKPINIDLINLFNQTYVNDTFLPSEIPRNISDIYKGIWMFQKTGKNDFKKINGRAVFKILNEKSSYDSIDIVYGTMTLRDGLYTTNRNSKFLLQGLYFWQSGELILLANPNDISSQQESNSNNNNNGFLPKTSKKDDDDDDDMEMTKTINKDRKKNFLQNIQFEFNLNHTISVSDILLQFSKLRNQTGEKSEVFSRKCYYEFYMKFSHFDKFADPEMKKKMNEDPNYFDERNDGSANPFIEQYGVGYSPNCETEMSISTNSIYFDDYYRKALNYVVFMCLATFIQVVVLLDQVDYTNSQTAISKVSIITIGQQSILDSYLCLVHLTAGLMMEPCFNAFAIASFLKFASFSIFQMRYLLSIWKSKLEGVGNIRIELGVFYMRFYSVLFSGFILLYYFFSFFDIFLIAFYSFWIPQIYSNCMGNYSKSLKMKYVIGTSLSRLYLPFYFLLCPKNFLFVEPKPKLILFLCVWLFMQNLVLWLQDKIGSRFFIPNFLSPPKYDYQHSLDLNLLSEDKDLGEDNNEDKEEKIFFDTNVVINNNNFDNENDVKNEINLSFDNNSSSNNQKNKKKFFCVICLSDIDLSDHDNSYMITPCNHLYHKQCLLQWMEHKMECCVCKRRLPYL